MLWFVYNTAVRGCPSEDYKSVKSVSTLSRPVLLFRFIFLKGKPLFKAFARCCTDGLADGKFPEALAHGRFATIPTDSNSYSNYMITKHCELTSHRPPINFLPFNTFRVVYICLSAVILTSWKTADRLLRNVVIWRSATRRVPDDYACGIETIPEISMTNHLYFCSSRL